MTKIFMLVAMFNGDWTMTPFTTEVACRQAIDGLTISIVTEADCFPMEMAMAQKDTTGLAPMDSPRPVSKPKAGRIA